MSGVERFAWRCIFFGLALIDLCDIARREWQYAKRATGSP